MTRLLIVEDEPANIQTLNGILRPQGYQVSVATNGLQALKVLESVRPELILLDVVMPGMDGFETCLQIKQCSDWRDIPVIFLTARAETSDLVRGFELGAVDYVAKPFHAHELLARVKTHLSIHRLRQENERLVRAESELARHRSVAEMVAGVAHELNTPLGIINTAAGLISRWASQGNLPIEDLQDATSLITRNAARAHKLVQDFKKVSVHQITDVCEQADLAELVKDTVHLFQVSVSRQLQIEVFNQLGAEASSWVGYSGSLSQVLLNLLQNARAYAYPEGDPGRVEIRLTSEEAFFGLSIRDFGKGIPPENLPRIFEPFFTTGRARGGSGLGMSIVHTIVTAHMQGSIRVESSLGQGTEIQVKLPRSLKPGPVGT